MEPGRWGWSPRLRWPTAAGRNGTKGRKGSDGGQPSLGGVRGVSAGWGNLRPWGEAVEGWGQLKARREAAAGGTALAAGRESPRRCLPGPSGKQGSPAAGRCGSSAGPHSPGGVFLTRCWWIGTWGLRIRRALLRASAAAGMPSGRRLGVGRTGGRRVVVRRAFLFLFLVLVVVVVILRIFHIRKLMLFLFLGATCPFFLCRCFYVEENIQKGWMIGPDNSQTKSREFFYSTAPTTRKKTRVINRGRKQTPHSN